MENDIKIDQLLIRSQFKDMSINLSISYKDKTLNIAADDQKTIKWVKEELKNQTKIPIIQQELSYKEGDIKTVLTDNEMPLKIAKLSTKTLSLKNLGKQIRWEMVFYIQYLGPILLLPLLYLLGKQQSYNEIQTTGLVLGILHYVKRQYETAYVHVFSRQSMPFKRVLINSFHYWILFALFNGIELFFFPSGHNYSHTTIAIIVGLWTTFELLNYKCHKIMGDFRRSPKSKQDKEYVNASKVRKIPYGFGFDLVSSANYFWQALGWIAFSILTRNYTAYLFTIFSIVQMTQWAIEKHRRYLKQFGDKYPKGRKAIFPFII